MSAHSDKTHPFAMFSILSLTPEGKKKKQMTWLTVQLQNGVKWRLNGHRELHFTLKVFPLYGKHTFFSFLSTFFDLCRYL